MVISLLDKKWACSAAVAALRLFNKRLLKAFIIKIDIIDGREYIKGF